MKTVEQILAEIDRLLASVSDVRDSSVLTLESDYGKGVKHGSIMALTSLRIFIQSRSEVSSE